MPRLLLIITVLCIFVSGAFAQDPDVTDSLIIGTVSIEPWSPSVMLPVYFVNDEPVERFVLPLEWSSSDGYIHPASVFFFNTLLEWAETYDTLDTEADHIVMTATCNNSGDDNPYLNTNLERELVALIRIVIHEPAEEQFMTLNTTFDANYGQTAFYYNDGVDLVPVVTSGGVIYQSVGVNDQAELPNDYNLSQNYPNPFNMKTEIAFVVPQAGEVNLEVYDILGRKIKTLVSENYDAGYYSVTWDGYDDSGEAVSSGLYFYKLRAADTDITKKMVLLK